MTNYNQIAIDLQQIFKSKAISRLTGVSVDALLRLRAGSTEHPGDPEACAKLVRLHETVGGWGWI